MKKCGKCSNQLEDNLMYCIKCGQEVTSETKSIPEQKTKISGTGCSIWTILIFFGVAMLITALGYLFNPYYNSSNEPASWSSGVYTD